MVDTWLEKGEIIVGKPMKKIENTKTAASYDVTKFSFWILHSPLVDGVLQRNYLETISNNVITFALLRPVYLIFLT